MRNLPVTRRLRPDPLQQLSEAAKLAPQWNPQLAEVRNRELETGHHNQATIAVARKLVAYLMAVDRSGKPFQFISRSKDQTKDGPPGKSPALSSAHSPELPREVKVSLAAPAALTSCGSSLTRSANRKRCET